MNEAQVYARPLARPAQRHSRCETCGSLYVEGIDGVGGRCALEPRTIEIWGRAYQNMTPRVAPPLDSSAPRRWRVVER